MNKKMKLEFVSTSDNFPIVKNFGENAPVTQYTDLDDGVYKTTFDEIEAGTTFETGGTSENGDKVIIVNVIEE